MPQNVNIIPKFISVPHVSPWSEGQTVNLCTGVGEELLSSGNMEEVFLHEGCHVSLGFMQEVRVKVCVCLSTPLTYRTLPGDVHRIWTKCSYPAMPGTTLLMRTQRRAWCLGLLCVTVGTGCLRRHWIRLCCLYLIG